MSSIPPDEIALSRQAAELLRNNHRGAFSTFSVKHPDFPFVSVANYAVSSTGEPIFFFSSLATHSKNIRANPRAALLVTETASSDESGLAAGRVTLMGTIKPVEEEQVDGVREVYLKANPESAQWASFGDFQFYRLEMIDVYFVAGFGAMGWVSPDEFRVADQ
jgi:putative heme iron utilization protein